MSHDAHDAHAAPSSGHDEHAHGDHGHGNHGHDDQGHGDHGHGDHGHGGQWVDYNSRPPQPSTLPPVPAWALAVMGLVLALLLGTIVRTSLSVDAAHREVREGAESPAASVEKAEK